MSKKSFDKFAYNGSVLDLKFLDNYAKKNNNRIGKFKSKIFCPECKNARLKYVPKPAPSMGYLASIDLDEHLDNCSYKYKSRSNSSTSENKMIEDLTLSEKKNKMDIVLRRLAESNENKSYENKSCSANEKVKYKQKNLNLDDRVNSRIAEISLTNKIDLNLLKSDDNLKMFYAKNVWFDYEERKDGEYYLPYIENRKGEKIDIYFPMGKNALGEPGYYNIVCIGKINEYNKIQLDEPKEDSIKLELSR